MKITTTEFNDYQREGNKVLSDMDYGMNQETKEFTVPSIEWDSYMGSYWSRYETEEDRTKALDEYQTDLEMWVKKRRVELKWEVEQQIKKELELKEMKTLGGQFPMLELLKLKL